MSFYQLLLANWRTLYRNWRGLFWTILLPLAVYVGLSLLKIPASSGLNIKYEAYLLPGIISMTIMQTGIFGLAYWLVDLKQRGVIKRFMVTPLSNVELIGSLITSRLAVMFAQVALIALVGYYFFGVKINGSVLAIAILTILGGAIFLSAGFLISSISKSYDEAAPITTIINITLTFLGNVFFPVSIFPLALRQFSKILPLTFLSNGLRTNFLLHGTLQSSYKDILGLLISFIIIFVVTIYVFKLNNE